ncbi:MAG: hypothetical protein ACO1SV_21435 [Fimbriimonas sp.]
MDTSTTDTARPSDDSRPDYMAMDRPHWDWLVIQHPDGRIEDLGFVLTQMLIPVLKMNIDVPTGSPRDDDFRQKFQWQSADKSRSGAVLLGDEDRDESGHWKAPYTVDRADGRQLWFVGREAYRKAVECGFLTRGNVDA